MPRKPRMYLPGIPAHVVQRGNNRAACFFTDEDHQFYLECLSRGLRLYEVELHAYVLMTNHVHLLMTPQDSDSISRLMQHLARLYVLYINKTYKRSGTLWEGRHKASLVQADNYLLTCYRYIELNPVAAGMVKRPEQYRWSSYGWHALGRPNSLITDHPLYAALSRDRKLPLKTDKRQVELSGILTRPRRFHEEVEVHRVTDRRDFEGSRCRGPGQRDLA